MWSAGARRDNGSFEVCKQFKCGEALQEALHDTRKQQQITVQNDFLFNFHLLCRSQVLGKINFGENKRFIMLTRLQSTGTSPEFGFGSMYWILVVRVTNWTTHYFTQKYT